jgi:hypothetical protein
LHASIFPMACSNSMASLCIKCGVTQLKNEYNSMS